MLETIKYHFARLGDFAGREGRKPYWLWFLFVFLLNFVASFAMGAVAAAGAASAALGSVAEGEAAVEGAVMEQMIPNMPMLVTVGIAMSILSAGLMGAAIVRRLRDGGLPTWLAFIPLAAVLVSAWLSIEQLGEIEEFLRSAMTEESIARFQQGSAWRGLIGWIPLICVVVAGLFPSKGQPAD